MGADWQEVLIYAVRKRTVFIIIYMNSPIAGGDECSRARCITFDSAHASLLRATNCHVRTLLPGP